MPDPKPLTTGLVDDPFNIPPPKLGPPSTGNLVADSFRSAIHIAEVPCARSSLLSGIAAGVGIGFIRGLSANPVVAGSWAIGTWAVISVTSWNICQNKIAKQQELTRMAIQNLGKQLRLKREDDKEPKST
ncbi:hypothetical protein C8F04DRAFT_45050 [Mycena alexandri]|uniref:Cytochrome c oxidase assembly protein COX20, mitochondrial n=1 Tax=Mycena alexandri TaxID=1745969 RepID=A0AAD6SLS1_9AGAR|nr:hypothetical protein C8F04DRAFT_45050 [Mycena alexandri]